MTTQPDMFAMDKTARRFDQNGWAEIKGNPISKVGVFPYLGRQIGAPNPDRIYMVYRPAEELSDPECIESFKLVPWIDEHEMLGDEGTPAEQKGIGGVIGEDVYFEYPYLKGNLKLFSSSLKAKIDRREKVELSPGYRCVYVAEVGIFDGTHYDYVQRTLRGNHLASVREGRTGPDVAVLDHMKITLDAKDFDMPAANTVTLDEATETRIASIEKTLSSLTTVLDALSADTKKLLSAQDAKGKDGEEIEGEGEDKHDPDAEKLSGEKGMDAKLKKLLAPLTASVSTLTKDVADLKGVKPAQALDEKAIATQMAAKGELVKQIEAHVGTFAHDSMTLAEVAAYGVKKLEIACDEGAELAALKGYLHNRPAPGAKLVGMDNRHVSNGASAVSDFYNSAAK